MRQEPQGFFEVTGFEPYFYKDVFVTTATFAARASAEMFAKEKGGEVRHREADGIMVNGKIVPVKA